jgi:N-acetylglucosamine-6-sulfatase
VLSRRRLQVVAGLVGAVLIVGGIVALVGTGGSNRQTAGPGGESGPATSEAGGAASRPNVVFVLTDDLSMNLVRFMPHVQAMERAGLTFDNYFVSDSLCCPSRASIFTGDFPHDTGVFSNFGPGGGFRAFYRHGDQRRTFPLALQRAGYATALMGKFLNGYLERSGRGHASDGEVTDVPARYVPPGFTDWDVAGWGYPEFNYTLNQNGVLHRYGDRPSDYLTDVIARDGVQFINRAVHTHKPFLLELATFAPHSPYVPAPRDSRDFASLRAPRPPSFDVLPTDAPQWLAGHPPLTRKQIAKINAAVRRRAQSVQAIDRMIGTIEQTLAADGISRNTYLIFSSDNGLHTGQYRLMPGKLTSFDTDIHVPLIVVGPGVPAGTSTGAMAENIDLAPTFAGIAHTRVHSDGHSLLGLFHGQPAAGWGAAILVEHHGGAMSVLDPDYQQSPSGSPTTYEAMRTRRFLYVEYADGEHEFYDLRTDPFELHNLARRLTSHELTQLHADLARLERCHGAGKCWAARHVAPEGSRSD